MKNIQYFINENLINESKESIKIGGVSFSEGDHIIYITKYEDENGDDVEEEIEGTLNEILPSHKINVEFSKNKFIIIKDTQLVGKCIKRTSYSPTSKENKLYDNIKDISYELNSAIDKLNNAKSEMEDYIVQYAANAWKKDNPDSKKTFDMDFADKYMDDAANAWTDEYDINNKEREIEKLKNELLKAQKNYDNYKDRIKYIKGYTPIKG